MGQMTFKEAKKRYNGLYWPIWMFYVVACIGGALLLRMLSAPPEWMKVVVAIFTVAPIFAVFWLIWRYVQETDEYTRLQQLQALAIGGMVTASVAGTVGFLELYEVMPEDWFPPFLFLPLFFFSYGISKWLRSGTDCG